MSMHAQPCSALVLASGALSVAPCPVRDWDLPRGEIRGHRAGQVRHGAKLLASALVFVLIHVVLITCAVGIAALNADVTEVVATALK